MQLWAVLLFVKTANSLYMFHMPSAPIMRRWYWNIWIWMWSVAEKKGRTEYKYQRWGL